MRDVSSDAIDSFFHQRLIHCQNIKSRTILNDHQQLLFVSGPFFGPDGEVDDDWKLYRTGTTPGVTWTRPIVVMSQHSHSYKPTLISSYTVPVATYILGPASPAQLSLYGNAADGGDLCENISCLGPMLTSHSINCLDSELAGLCGSIVTAAGIRVSYISAGATSEQAARLAAVGALGPCDVLVTHHWPKDVLVNADIKPVCDHLMSCIMR